MRVTIENPTAEAIAAEEKPYWEDPTYSGEWSEEDLADFARAQGLLIEKRFGPETGDYG